MSRRDILPVRTQSGLPSDAGWTSPDTVCVDVHTHDECTMVTHALAGSFRCPQCGARRCSAVVTLPRGELYDGRRVALQGMRFVAARIGKSICWGPQRNGDTLKPEDNSAGPQAGVGG